MIKLFIITLVFIFTCASLTHAKVSSDEIIFAASLRVPSFLAKSILPIPLDEIDPLAAAQISHWRCRYKNGRLIEIARRDKEGTIKPMWKHGFPYPEHGLFGS